MFKFCLYKTEFPQKLYLTILSALWFKMHLLWSVSKVSPLAGILNIAHMFRTSVVWHDEESSGI